MNCVPLMLHAGQPAAPDMGSRSGPATRVTPARDSLGLGPFTGLTDTLSDLKSVLSTSHMWRGNRISGIGDDAARHGWVERLELYLLHADTRRGMTREIADEVAPELAELTLCAHARLGQP